MDSKDLRTEPVLSGRNNEGNKYAQSGGRLQCDKNKSYQDIGSNSLAKVEVQNTRPCAVIGPDRVVPPSATSEAYQKKGPAEPWPCPDDTYRRPPEYPHKLSNYQSPIRNISPRQTFQENMQRIMVPPTYNSMKINDDSSNYAQTSDRNIALSKNIKLSVPSEAKYCDVPYAVNLNNSEQKSVRNAEMCVSSVNSPLSRTNSHGWPPGSANLRSSRSYGAPELYQYQEYPSCAGPRPVAPRSNRNITDESGYVYTDPYYTDGNIRFKPTYPPVKDRIPLTRYDYIGNYSNSFHPPPFPPQKYDLHKSMPHHPFPPYTPIKYLDNRVSEPVLDGYQRNQQGNMTYHNQVVHPNFSTIIGNCTPNKVHPFPPEVTGRTNVPNKTPYDNNTKTYDYDGRPKIYPPSDAYFVNEMARLHPMRGQVLMPNFPNLNMHAGPYNQYYKKENAQVKNYEYMSHYRNLDPALSIHNPMMRYPPLYSPNTLPISPNDSSIGNDPNQTLGLSQEDCSYVSQSPSVRSIDSAPTRIPNDYYRRYYDSRYGHLVRPSGMMMKSELHSNNNTSKDKKNIDVRQFLQMWNEGDEETEDSNPKDIVIKTGSSNDKKLTKTHEVVNNQEQLYVLGLVNVPNEELSKYEHIQTVSKLPDNIKGYNSIELLDQFEEAIESSKINKLRSQNFNENLYVPMKGVKPKQFTGILPRPISPLDVEAKISQSVIHKEVGCNFEIKPCSPKMLNVEITTPVQNILAERVIEKVVNPGMMKSPMVHGMEQNTNCNLMKRQDLGLSMSENVRIPSCKMINTQFSNMNSIDPIKSSYSLHDLESNSGLCLASLPRLDNDIELNFPEVNQQFINDNKGEPIASLSSLKDLPKLEVFNQSNIETKYNSNEIKVSVLTNNQSLNAITQTYKNQQSPSNTDTEKEFSKLSKFRKNKTNCPEELEKKRVLPEDQVQNAVRTDSVIIKNPENIKKYEENSPIFSPNCFDELQEAPMNLTSQVSFDIHQKGNGVNNNCNKINTESEYAAIAIDFSLNKNHLEDLKPTETETVAIETENVLLQDTEESNLNIDCVTNTLKVTSSNRSLHSSEDDGQVSNDVITNCDVSEKQKIPAQDNNDKILFDLNSDTNNSVEELSILNQNDSGNLTNHNNKENLNKAISGECIDTECEIKSENPEVDGPLREDKNDYSLINADNIDKDPLNKLGEKTNNFTNMEVVACETHNKNCIKNNDKLQISCNTDSSEIKPVKSIIMQVDTDKKINITNVKNNSHASDIVLVSSVQIETCEQANQNSEMCIRSVNDNIRDEKNETHMMCVNPVQNEAGEEENLIEMVCPVENIVCDQTNFINEICVNPVQNEVCEQVHVSVPLDPNVATSNIQHSPTREDIKNNQINNESSKEDLNTRPNSPFTNSIGDSEAEENVKFDTADYNIQESQSEIRNKNPLVYNEESLSKFARQHLRIWSKEMFSPWIRKLLTFSEGNINILNNLETSMKNMPSKSTDNDIENSLHFNKNLNDVDKCDKDLEVIDNEVVIAYNPPNLSNTINMCDSLDDLKFISEPSNDDRDDKINTDERDLVGEKYLSDDNNSFISALSPNVESPLKDDKNGKGTPSPSSVNIDSDMSTDQITVVKDSIVSTNTENLHESKGIIFFEDTSAVVETQNILSDEIKNDTENLFLSNSIGKDEICNSLLKEELKVVATFDENVIENQENTDGKIDDGIQTMRKQQKPLLKRSLSDSALNAYGFNTKLNKQHENQSLWPVKRRKIDKPENVDQDILTQNLCSIIQHNRRNSFSAICNEDDVSFCILIDNSCIIADEENEEQKICYTELSGELEVQNELFSDEVGDNIVMDPATQSPQINTECEYSDSFTFDCEEKTLANSWVEDVACIETVISDDIAENIVISGPSSPKDIDFSDNDESGVFSSCEHTDKVKFIYGDKMCSDDALYLETLYNTPQMDVNKKLSRRGTQVVNESSKYYDNDSLEKILSESNGKESSTSEIMHSIQLLDVGNSNTPDDKENMNVEDFSLQNNLNSGDDVEDYIEKEILQPKLLLQKTQDDTVHSCESSIDNVFSYKDDPKEDSNITSCSPEVSSTTSEDKGSSILLKITNYKGSRISQINKISSVINRPSCKFTEVNDYLHSHSNMSKNRPLLTKAAQKYIPPIKESIRDLKVKLTLPQHSLMKLKQLKQSKDEPKTIKQNTTISRILKKPKPKFEDVLMSIDEIQFQKHKEKTKKTKKFIPKVVIKKSQTGSHYASTSNNDHFNPDLTGRKWQPWVFLEKNHFIDKMASRKKTKAVYNHRKKCYVLLEKFKKYKSVYNTKFVISQPKTDNSSSGLKYTIRLKHNY